jgi:outer membrane scaffolding protein for murein synthesis (MipA/OmpV family)
MDEMRAAFLALLAISTSGELTAQARPAGAPPALTVGAMAVIVPEYPGADEYRVIPLPMTQFSIGHIGSYLAPSATQPRHASA